MNDDRTLHPLETAYQKLNTLAHVECSCDSCKNRCKTFPCLGTPEDIKKLIDAGYSQKLMLNYYVSHNSVSEDVYYISPATKGKECKFVVFPAIEYKYNDSRECVFFENGECTINDLKPIEGKLVDHSTEDLEIHYLVISTWDSKKANELRKEWQKSVGCSTKCAYDYDEYEAYKGW
jgi:hypothetical protein